MLATLLFQATSAVLIGWLLLYFANMYQRKYLYYWSFSFFSLTIFLLGSCLGIWLILNQFDPSSLIRLGNLFLLSTAGYMQIAFLMIGTVSLVNGTEINQKTFVRILIICMLIALGITLFKNWSVDDQTLRYFTRVGLRYFTAGLACLGTAIYILRNDPNPLIGKQLVTIGFFVYGFEMSFLGWLTFENHFLNGSRLLEVLVPYHGMFELILYPMIGTGLVVWLLEVERLQSKKVADQLQNINLSDGLTGLPNQQALQKYLKQWSQFAKANEQMTLAFFGVDKMARFNEGEGIENGDQLLVALGKRIDVLCTGQAFYGRLYGDVFVLLLNGYGKAQLSKIESLRKNLSRPYKLNNKTYHLEVSAGSTSMNPETDHQILFKQANLALQSAKLKGGKQSQFYQEGLHLPASADISFENELRTAFKQKQFEIYYQPIWSDKNNITCFEALIRWNHPKRGVLAPATFLYLVQQLGLIVEMDFWVTEQAFEQIKKWRSINPDAAKICINLSADTIQHGGIVEHIKNCSLKHKVTTQHITAEITENTAMHNIESGTNTLNKLRELGIKIAIDDFGTGYSSLNYLRSFPSDVIKFDRSFVSDDRNHDINHEILKALVPLCHELSKKVVIEGVENKKQFEQVAHFDVDGYQGYYLCYPVKEAEATKMLTIGKKSPVKTMLNA